MVKSARIEADYHLPLLPGTNVPIINAFAHVIVSEGLLAEDYIRYRPLRHGVIRGMEER